MSHLVEKMSVTQKNVKKKKKLMQDKTHEQSNLDIHVPYSAPKPYKNCRNY